MKKRNRVPAAPLFVCAALICAATVFAACAVKPAAPATPSPTAADTPAEAPDDDEPAVSSFPFKFTVEDLYGEVITDASLGDKDIFFVHYWATW